MHSFHLCVFNQKIHFAWIKNASNSSSHFAAVPVIVVVIMSDWWTSLSETVSQYVPSYATSSTTNGTTNGTTNAMSEEEFRKRAITRMDSEFAKKYGNGATYNFKLVVRGDTSTGKSTLLRRLRGGTFIAEYTPTKEIKTAHVAWRAKSCPEDNVVLEVWDVVDKAPKRTVSESLTLAKKVDAAESGRHTFPLDATVVDVYQGAHACCVMVDPSKRWTFDYAMRELEKLPKHIPSAMVLNFRDYPDDKRSVSLEEAEACVEDAFGERPFKPVVIEISLLNCFGLSSVSTFLHVPFLCLKRASLEQALTLNTTAIVQAQEALEACKHASYESYTTKLGVNQPTPEELAAEAKAKEEADKKAKAEAEESSLSWNKLSNMTVGQIPLAVAGAALTSTASAVSNIASKTPAQLSEEMANNLKTFATLGGSSSKDAASNSSGTTPDASPLPPQFSHLGPGGIERAAFGGRDIADDDKVAIEAMVKNKGGDGHWLSDDEGGDESTADSEEEEDEERNVAVKMDGWDDEDEEDTAREIDPDSPAHFIRQISKDDPFFGKSDEKPKKNGAGKNGTEEPKSPNMDLDPERLAAAFDATPASPNDYETLEDPLGLALAKTAASSSEMLSGSEKKDKKKKSKKKDNKKKSGSSASKSKKKSAGRDWDESD